MAAMLDSKQRRQLCPPEVSKGPPPPGGHTKIMDCCSIVPPCGGLSERYATGGRDGTVRLWSAKVRGLHWRQAITAPPGRAALRG